MSVHSFEMESEPICNQDAASPPTTLSSMKITETPYGGDIASTECSSDQQSIVFNQSSESNDESIEKCEPKSIATIDSSNAKESQKPVYGLDIIKSEESNLSTEEQTRPLSTSLVADIPDNYSEGKHSPLSAVSEEPTSSISIDLDEEVEIDLSNPHQPKSVLTLQLVDKIIQKLRRCRSRTDKPRIVRALQKSSSLSRQEAVDFLNQAMEKNQIERVKYRDYFGIRLVTDQSKMDKSDLMEDLLSENNVESMEEEGGEALVGKKIISEKENPDRKVVSNSVTASLPLSPVIDQIVHLEDSKLIDFITTTIQNLHNDVKFINGIDCETLSQTLESTRSLKISSNRLQALIDQHIQNGKF